MKARVSYNPDKSMWLIETKGDNSDWELNKAYKVKDQGIMHAFVSDAILDELTVLYRNDYEIIFDD